MRACVCVCACVELLFALSHTEGRHTADGVRVLRLCAFLELFVVFPPQKKRTVLFCFLSSSAAAAAVGERAWVSEAPLHYGFRSISRSGCECVVIDY